MYNHPLPFLRQGGTCDGSQDTRLIFPGGGCRGGLLKNCLENLSVQFSGWDPILAVMKGWARCPCWAYFKVHL